MSSMAGKRVLIVGDVMMDEYVWGNVRRISPEAPVMIIEVERESYNPGGAANVVNNVQALGGITSIIGVIGDDEMGRALANRLSETGADVSGLVADGSRPTTRKTRIIAHSQQVVRVDRESRKKLGSQALKQVVSRLEDQVPSMDIIVFSDYDKGMAVSQVTQCVLDLARKHRKRIVVNAKPRNFKQFRSASVISLNQSEAEAVTGIAISDERDLKRAVKRLLSVRPGADAPEALLITRGPLGMSVFEGNGDAKNIPPHLVEVYDGTGAGDTVVSVMALALASGASIQEAAVLANCAGAAVVRKVGVATVAREEIASMMRDQD